MPKIQRVPEANVEYAYGIYMLTPKHRVIKTLKKRYQPSIHGHKTWGSSFLVMDYLRENGLRKGATALEVGCGWAPLSVHLAHEYKARVTALDLDREVFPFVDVLAELNAVELETRRGDFTKLKGKDLGQYRYIVGGDICFWDSLVEPLARMVNRAIKNGTQRIIIADPGRPTFYEFCDLVSQRHETRLAEWYAIEPEHYEGEIVEIRPRKKGRKK